jgi:hypothetical protein
MKKKKPIRCILLLTLLGCAFCLATVLLISWWRGRQSSPNCVSEEDTQRQTSLSQWLFYESVGGDDCGEEEKDYLDLLVRRWTNGELTDDELSEQMTEYLIKKGMTISTMGVQSQMLCLFGSAQELPDYAQMLAEDSGTYDFIGIYTNGEYDAEGSLLCYYWEAGVRSA